MTAVALLHPSAARACCPDMEFVNLLAAPVGRAMQNLWSGATKKWSVALPSWDSFAMPFMHAGGGDNYRLLSKYILAAEVRLSDRQDNLPQHTFCTAFFFAGFAPLTREDDTDTNSCMA
mmetsp:Transcript_8343/g.15615  ORF Transcript_8343/g.15615 Transcript_8343/m.15615 type:complete len:119 (-) Transcript_8343:92-448(-)